MQAFFDDYSQIHHYCFCIEKCGSSECEICKPVQMDSEHFKGIHCLPDLVMGSDEHYIPFTDAYGTDTSESEHPSLIQRRKMSLDNCIMSFLNSLSESRRNRAPPGNSWLMNVVICFTCPESSIIGQNSTLWGRKLSLYKLTSLS